MLGTLIFFLLLSEIQVTSSQSSTGSQLIAQSSECPALQRIENINCGQGPDRMDCPAGARCMTDPAGGPMFCCWEQSSIVSSPCSNPLMRGSEFHTCDRTTPCPNRCYTCQALAQDMSVGLCCPDHSAGCGFSGAGIGTGPETGSFATAQSTLNGGDFSRFGAGDMAGGIIGGTGIVAGGDFRTEGVVSRSGDGTGPVSGGFVPSGGAGVPDPRFGALVRTPFMMGEFCYGGRPPLGYCSMPMGGCPPFSTCILSRSGRGICCATGVPGPTMPRGMSVPVLLRGIPRPVGPMGPMIPRRFFRR